METILKAFASSFRSGVLNHLGNKMFELGVKFSYEIDDYTAWLSITDTKGVNHSIDIPVPFVENGAVLIKYNDVKRAVCNYLFEETGQVYNYVGVISKILFELCPEFTPEHLQKQVPFVYQMATAVKWDTVAITTRNIQRTLNSIINRYPLHETYMNSFAMNNRLIIIDPEFDALSNPKDQHDYQLRKADKYFDRGWTTMGLSDGVLAGKNYILTTNLKRFSPFGLNYHNPQRNLYSTLGMRGDELPLIQSESMKALSDQGIQRTGWNLFTVFVDIPDVWEDQLMVDNSLANKGVTYDRRYQIFGTLSIKEGDVIKVGQVIAVSPDGQPVTFKEIADRAVVSEINGITVNVGGTKVLAHSVIVKLTRKFKDGVKLTNTAANKGVIRMADLGYAVDPRTGEKRKIDVIVSSKAVNKRKNYTQLLEAIMNNVCGEQPTVIADDILVTAEQVEESLVSHGLPADGTWKCNTYAGEFDCVAGLVFWGLTHDVEDMLWDKHDTNATNGRGLRSAGLKFSTVEMRALETRFGKDNPVLDEVMSYAQGTDDIQEKLHCIKGKRGEFPNDRYLVPITKVVPVDVSRSTIVPKSSIRGTVVDDEFFPEGFVLQLPITFEICYNADGEVEYEGHPRPNGSFDATGLTVVRSDRVYVPAANLRKCWRHPTGRYGLSEIGTLVNTLVLLSYKYMAEPDKAINVKLLFNTIFAYFNRITRSMSTKRGDVSVYGMAIRYPFSAKAVATLSNTLPKNTIEIHRAMAENLEVTNGDVVLVERFPCLGFMSIRPQKIRITDNEQCRYTIRVSGNSLGSLGLDFDGDVLYLASFHTDAAKKALVKEWTNPNKSCYENIVRLNKKMGHPNTNTLKLQDYNISAFPALTIEAHNAIVDKATGVKSYTGPVIALAYNIMRIVENSEIHNNQKTNCAVEIFLDKVANSIFKQKHGATPLRDIVVDAVCTGDIETLVKHGFERSTSTIICDTIKSKALLLGVTDLVEHHKQAKEKNSSNIINKIVRKENKVYFASRAALEPIEFLHHLEQPAVDVPSKILHWVMSGKAKDVKNIIDIRKEDAVFDVFKTPNHKEACKGLCEYIDILFAGAKKTHIQEFTDEDSVEIQAHFNKVFKHSRSTAWQRKQSISACHLTAASFVAGQ